MSFQQTLNWNMLHNHYLLSKRKKRASVTGMYITSLDDHFYPTDGSISVNVTGHTKKGYVVSFSKTSSFFLQCAEQFDTLRKTTGSKVYRKRMRERFA